MAARAAGFAGAESHGRDVAALVDHLSVAWRRPQRVLYLAGADRTMDVAAALGPLGHDVTTAIVYDAVKATRFSDVALLALREGAIDAVLHYSARTAEAFVACCGADIPLDPAPFRHLCLSAKVGEVLRSAGGSRILVAERPDEEALLALLA
jgi:uroporphyrinogen-III synthase